MAASAPGRAVPDLSFMLAHAAHVLATRMTAAFTEIGITPRHDCVLYHAASTELTQIELARLSDLDKTTMVVTLDELEAAGYADAARPAPTGGPGPSWSPMRAGGWSRPVTRLPTGCTPDVLAELPAAGRGLFVDSLAQLVGGLLAEPVACERPVRRARQTAG